MYRVEKIQYKDYTIRITETEKTSIIFSWKNGLPYEFVIINEPGYYVPGFTYFVQELNLKTRPDNIWAFNDYETAKEFALNMIKKRLEEE